MTILCSRPYQCCIPTHGYCFDILFMSFRRSGILCCRKGPANQGQAHYNRSQVPNVIFPSALASLARSVRAQQATANQHANPQSMSDAANVHRIADHPLDCSHRMTTEVHTDWQSHPGSGQEVKGPAAIHDYSTLQWNNVMWPCGLFAAAHGYNKWYIYATKPQRSKLSISSCHACHINQTRVHAWYDSKSRILNQWWVFGYDSELLATSQSIPLLSHSAPAVLVNF